MDTDQMTAKEYLAQAYHIDQRINAKLEQVQALHNLATRATVVLSGMPKTPNRTEHGMEDFINKAIDLEAEIHADLNRLIETKRDIVMLISQVEKKGLQTILESRYLCFKSWEQIAGDMHFDVRWVHRLHGRALDAVDEIRHYRPL